MTTPSEGPDPAPRVPSPSAENTDAAALLPEKPPPDFPGKPFLTASAMLIAVVFFSTFFVGSALYAGLKAASLNPLVSQLIGIFGGQLAGVAVAFQGLRSLQRSFKVPAERLGIAASNDWNGLIGQGWRIYFVSLPGLFLVASLFTWLSREYHFTADRPALQEMIQEAVRNPWAILLFMIVVSVGAPLYEELLFRGVVYSAIRMRGGFLISLVLTALVFAAMHDLGQTLGDPRSFPFPIFYLGIVLGIIRERTASVVPGMIVHGLNNLFALIVTLLQNPAH